MILVALILVVINNTVLNQNNLKKYIKGKKFTVSGLFMAAGVSSGNWFR